MAFSGIKLFLFPDFRLSVVDWRIEFVLEKYADFFKMILSTYLLERVAFFVPDLALYML